MFQRPNIFPTIDYRNNYNFPSYWLSEQLTFRPIDYRNN